MAAVIEIFELTASEVGTEKTSGTVRFKLANDQTVDSSDPITIPSTGAYQTHSYTKNLRLYCATVPDTYIDNLECYSDASNDFGSGVTVNASQINDFLTNATTWERGSDLFAFTSAAAMDLDAFHTASVNATGFCGDIVLLQMLVASAASSGTLGAETVTFSYDEV